ncbi:MAG: hypothetical protein ABIJ96_06895 [Elusimicrobiota bacterium]
MRVIEIITIGLPFCVFKFILGMLLVTRPGFHMLGGALAILAVVDGLINLANLGSLLARGKRAAAPCLTAAVAGYWPGKVSQSAREDIGISLDVLLAMSIVAYVIGSGAITQLEPQRALVWNVCVILNVMGAGLSRLSRSISRAAAGDRRARS